jgi:hypothetical protein
MSDLERIEARMTELRAELERLEIARSVLSELYAAAPTPPRKDKANGAAFTIRRVEEPAAKGKTAKPKRGSPDRKAAKAKVREKVLAEMANGPVTSGALCKKFKFHDAAEKQLVYQALYELKTEGRADRDEHSAYRLTASAEPPSVAAH